MTRTMAITIAMAGMAAGAAWAQVTPNCTPTTLPQVVGETVSVQCAPSGGTAPYTWSIQTGGALPPGLSQDSATGAITGTLKDPAGPYSFTVVATDSTQAAGSQSYSGTTTDFTVGCTSALGPLEVGVLYTNSCTAAGGTPPYSWSIVGQIVPPLMGAAITPTGNPATINYVPGSSLLAYQYSVVVTDSSNALLKRAQQFTGAIGPAITTSSPLPAAAAGSPYAQQFAATAGSPPYTWSATGLAGTGLTMGTTGLLSGTPAAAGPVNFTVTAADGAGGASSGPFVLPVTPALAISPGSPLPAATVNQPYSQTFTATGGSGSGYTWSATGLPAWLTLNGAVLTGTPPLPPASSVTPTFTVMVTDSNGNSTSGAFTLPVTLVITTTSPLPPATVGTVYSQALAAGGGTGGYTWSVTGALPAGLSLSPGGVISGTPLPAAVDASFQVTVTDKSKASVSAPFTLPVTLAIATASPLPAATIGVAYNQTLAAVGGAGGYTWSVTTGTNLPSWLQLNSTTGALTGMPPATAINASFSVTVTDKSSASATAPLILPVTLTITTSALANGAVNAAYNQTLTGAGGTPPYAWALAANSSPLPDGLTLASSPTIGTICCTPTKAGTFPSIIVQLTDSATPATAVTKQFTIIIGAGLTITTAPALPNATVGVAYSQTLAAVGGVQPYTWSPAGALPGSLAALSLSGTGAIAGTPTATGTGSFPVTVTDGAGATANQTFTLTIVTPPVITTPSPLPNGTAGAPYSQILAASGGTSPYKWTLTSGILPAGLSLSTAGAISGSPGAAGTFNFTVELTDATGVAASKAFALTIITGLTISTTSPLPAGEVNIAYSQTLAVTGGAAPYTWSVTAGVPPPGLTLAASGVLSGMPGTVGTFNFTVQAADSNHVTASAAFALTIAGTLGISTPAALGGGSVNSSYSQTLAASAGVGPFTWTLVVGPLPPGLNLSPAGTIAGIPTATGTFPFTAKVTDLLGATASRQFTIVVVTGLTVTSPTTLPGATVGVSYSDLLQAAGGSPPYTWTNPSGSPPAGLSVGSNGNVSGIPTAAGSATFTVQVTDSLRHQASAQLSITVAPALSISTTTLPGGTVGTPYSQSLAATGGTPPYTWAVLTGALPGGLTLTATGAITGTPTATGTFPFTIGVTDSASGTANQQLTLIVGGGLALTTTELPGGKVGTPYSQALTATGGTPPYTFTKSAGSLPPGISLSGAVLGGTPTSPGSYTFTIQVADSVTATATHQFTIAITGLAITTTALPAAAVGTAYSQTLSASGTAPFSWATAPGSALPDGLSLDASSGTISGTPTAAGTSSVTIQVADSTTATASAVFTLTVISASFSGISSTAAAAQQLSGSLALGAAYPLEITGQVMLAFQPDASLAWPADDPSIQFSTGGRTASFSIPANSTAPVTFSLQTGSVAGGITLTVSWQAGGATLAAPAALTQAIQIAHAVPVISAITAATTSSGFQVVITGYSTTREVSQALLQFTAAPGQTLQTTSLTVPLSSAATTWYQSSASDQYGSQFILTLPFTVTNGTASAIGSISVQLVNSQGASTSASATL